MSAPGVFRAASTCSLATCTQIPFPVMPADMTTQMPLEYPDVGPGSSNCV